MGTKVGELFVVLDTKLDRFNRGMTDAEQAMVRVGKKFTAVGKNLTKFATLPILAVGVASVKAFADFDKAMTESLAIMGPISDSMRDKMEGVAKTISEETTFAASELAEAYYYLASAGMTAEQSVAALDKVAAFAQAGAFDLATATDLLTDAQTAMGLSSKDAAENQKNLVRVSDVLVGANTLANASVQQFSESLTNMAAAALTNVNKGLEEGVAILAAFADKGIKGQKAGMKLQMMLNSLDKAASKNKEAWEEYNIQLWDAEGNMRNVGEIIGDMEVAFKDLTPEAKAAALAQLGFDTRTKSSIQSLMGSSEKIIQWTKDLKEMGGVTERVAAKQMESFSNQLKEVRNMLVNVGADIGEVLVPALKDLIDNHVKPGIKWFKDLSDGQKEMIVKTAGLVAALGPLLVIMGQVLKTAVLLRTANIKLGASFSYVVAPIGLAYGAYKGLMAIRDKYHKQVTGKHIPAADDEQKAWNNLEKVMGRYTDAMGKLSGKMKEQGVEISARGEIIKKIDKSWQDHGQTIKTYKEILAGKWGEDAKKALLAIGGAELEAAVNAGELEKATGAMNDIIKKAEKIINDTSGAIGDDLNPKLKNQSAILSILIPKLNTYGLALKSVGETAVPAARNLSDVLDQVPEKFDDSTKAAKDFGKEAGKASESVGDSWENVTDDMARAFGDAFASMIKEAKSFGDFMRGLSDSLLNVFSTALGNMVSTAITNFDKLAGMMKGMFVALAAYVSVNIIQGLFTSLGLISQKVDAEVQAVLDRMDEAIAKGKELLDVVSKSTLSGLGRQKSSGDPKERGGVIGDDWGAAIEKAMEKGIAAVAALVRKFRESGQESKEMVNFIIGQLSRIPSALTSLVKGIKLKFDEGIPGEFALNTKQLTGFANIASLTFKSLIAEGKTFMQAFEIMKEPIQALIDKFKKAGEAIPGFLQPMVGLFEKMELKPKVFERLDAARTILESLGNTAYLTQGAFDTLANSTRGFARAIMEVDGNLNKNLKTMNLTDDQIQQMLPMISQFVGAAAAFGLSVPTWMKTFVKTQLEGISWKEFQEKAEAQANAGIKTVEKLTDIDEGIKKQTQGLKNAIWKLGNRITTTLKGVGSPAGDRDSADATVASSVAGVPALRDAEEGEAKASNNITIVNKVVLNGMVVTDREHTRKRVIPEIISALDANVQKTRFKKALGIT